MRNTNFSESPLIKYYLYGDGEIILFVHGGFSNGRASWKRQIGELAAFAKLIVVDRRGHGLSPKLPRPYTVWGDALDILRVTDLMGIDRIHLVGHSYGALVALEIVVRQEIQVNTLHLIEPPALSILRNDPAIVDLSESLRGVQRLGPIMGRDWTARLFLEKLQGKDFVEYAANSPAWNKLLLEASRFWYEQFAADYDLDRNYLANLQVPTWVYVGSRSNQALIRVSKELCSLLPCCKLVQVPDGTHMLQAESYVLSLQLLSLINT